MKEPIDRLREKFPNATYVNVSTSGVFTVRFPDGTAMGGSVSNFLEPDIMREFGLDPRYRRALQLIANRGDRPCDAAFLTEMREKIPALFPYAQGRNAICSA